MEAEKIKTIEEFLIEYMDQKPKVYNDGITERCYPVSAVIQMMKDHASQFKQPPVSVMSEGLVKALKIIADWELPPTGKYWDEEKTQPISYQAEYGSNGARDYVRNIAKKALESLSKEAPKEQNICGVACDCSGGCALNQYQQPPNKERETAIEFAEWVTKNGFDVWRGNDNDYGKWNDGKNTSYYNPSELFDLFKQMNK